MSKIFCFAANGSILGEFRSENAHLALLNSAFRVSLTQNRPHFRLKQKYLDKLLGVSQLLDNCGYLLFGHSWLNQRVVK